MLCIMQTSFQSLCPVIQNVLVSLDKSYRPKVRVYVFYSPRAFLEGNKSHNYELKADKRVIFTLARIPQGMQKYSEDKRPLFFIFLLFFHTPCWHWWDSQISRLVNYIKSFKVAFQINCSS